MAVENPFPPLLVCTVWNLPPEGKLPIIPFIERHINGKRGTLLPLSTVSITIQNNTSVLTMYALTSRGIYIKQQISKGLSKTFSLTPGLIIFSSSGDSPITISLPEGFYKEFPDDSEIREINDTYGDEYKILNIIRTNSGPEVKQITINPA